MSELPDGDGLKREMVVESADKVGPGPLDQVKTFGGQDVNERIVKAVEASGNEDKHTEKDSSWVNSHESNEGKKPGWETKAEGKPEWEAREEKRGGTEGPDQRQNPWYGLNTDKTNALNQSY